MPKKFRYRWGLRSLFVLVTLAALILAARTNERYSIRQAIRQVELNGGCVLYHWESPVVKDQDFSFTFIGNFSKQSVDVVVTKFSFGSDDRPGAKLIDFLIGGHTDIDVHTVVVEADNINDDLVDALGRLKNLQSVRWVYNVQKVSEEERLDKIHRLEEVLSDTEVKFAANYNLDDRK